MKKMIGLLLYGLVMFGVAAGGAWFLRAKQADSAPDATAAANADPDDVSSLFPEPDPLLAPEVSPKDDLLPVAVRPQAMSVEEIVRYGLGLKTREESMRKREEALQRAESQQRLVLADIEGEQKQIEGLLAQARDQKTAAEELLQKVSAERKKMEAEQAEAAKNAPASTGSPAAVDADKQANLKDLTEVVQGMSPEGAGGILREWANNGKADIAVQILSNLEERKAASILDSMKDEQLVGELLEKFTELQRPPKSPKKR
ncbi:MAG: hypothetical protein R3C19_20810 [Planctomycetaceae bacterium]